MNSKSRLHIPHPPARPGEKPDFSYLQISPAGVVARPDVNAHARDIESLAYDMVRVLDDDHSAIGPWHPHLDPQDLQVALRHIMLTRIFDDRMLRNQRQGKTTFYMKSTGEEAVSIAQCMALEPGDMCFPSYRNQGLYVARGRSLVDLMCQCLSNTRDMCKGRQMPIMYHWREGRIFSISGNLTTQVPQAVGWAMAAAIKGEDDIAATLREPMGRFVLHGTMGGFSTTSLGNASPASSSTAGNTRMGDSVLAASAMASEGRLETVTSLPSSETALTG